MKKKSNFEKKYPLFVPYFTDEMIQNNMLENDDLLRKYNAHTTTIGIFIEELDRRFDAETVMKILQESILKYPDELLLSFISAYLNSDEATKSNANVVNFYNKTLHLGEDCIKYIEENGIIANRNYHNLPEMVVDALYNDLDTKDLCFKEEKLDDVYPSLGLQQKRLVVNLVKMRSFYILDLLFVNFACKLNALIGALSVKKIDALIINNRVLKELSEYHLMLLVYMLLELEYPDLSVVHVKRLIDANRFGLLKVLITNGYIEKIFSLTYDEVDKMSDQEIINELNKNNINLVKKDD